MLESKDSWVSSRGVRWLRSAEADQVVAVLACVKSYPASIDPLMRLQNVASMGVIETTRNTSTSSCS